MSEVLVMMAVVGLTTAIWVPIAAFALLVGFVMGWSSASDPDPKCPHGDDWDYCPVCRH